MREAIHPVKPLEKHLAFLNKRAVPSILLAAALIRLKGMRYGHFDEFHIVNRAYRMLASGDLNPHWFGPGSFVMYVLAALFAVFLGVYFLYCLSCGEVQTFAQFKQLVAASTALNDAGYTTARVIMVIFAVITVYLVYLIGKRLFNRPIGVIAAFCLALAPLHINYTRVARPDSATTMLVVLSMYFLFRHADQLAKTKYLILSALCAGFSIAAKYTSGIIVLPVLIHPVRMVIHTLIHFTSFRNVLSKVLLFILIGVLIFIGFFIFSPFFVLEYQKGYEHLVYEARGVHPGHERLLGIHNHLWYLNTALRTGMGGLFFELFAGLGLIWVLWRRSYKRILLLVFPIAFFIAIGFGQLRWQRWAITILPFEAILFAVGFYGLYTFLAAWRSLGAHRKKVAVAFAAVLIGFSIPHTAISIKEAIRRDRPATMTVADQWVCKNLPVGSRIVFEAPVKMSQPRRFRLMFRGLGGVLKYGLTDYRNNGLEYIILTSSRTDRYYRQPQKYAGHIQRYEEIEAKCKLVKRIDNKFNPGPVIEIFQLPVSRTLKGR